MTPLEGSFSPAALFHGLCSGSFDIKVKHRHAFVEFVLGRTTCATEKRLRVAPSTCYLILIHFGVSTKARLPVTQPIRSYSSVETNTIILHRQRLAVLVWKPCMLMVVTTPEFAILTGLKVSLVLLGHIHSPRQLPPSGD